MRIKGLEIGAVFGDSVELKLLDADDDGEEVKQLKEILGLSMLPIVALIKSENGERDVLYKIGGMFDEEIVSEELERWAKGLD